MPLLPEFPISGDDYTVGTITTTAGKKEFITKDGYLNSFGAVRPGDHIYISTTGKILVIGSITGENSGTFTDACPDDCAVKDLPLRVIYKTASSRVQGRIAMLLEKFSKGYLAAFSEITAKENQIFQATNVDGELKAIDLNADNIAETDKRKFMPDVISADIVKETDKSKIMTAEERLKLAKLKADLTAADIAETDTLKIMTADERNKLAGIAGLEQREWNTGKNTTEALISPSKFVTALDALGVWRGGSRFGTASSGGFILPNGMIVQFGLSGRAESDYRLTFPMAFPTACTFFNGINAYGYDGLGGGMFIGISASNISRDAADIRCRKMTAGGGVDSIGSVPVYWFAVGF